MATNTPSIEALTEFTVETNGFKAEYGAAGGGAINFISKSGTNDFHGVAYEYARNDAFDARGFFQARKQIYKQHDFGATIGGPVWIPKIYNGRNRTFFFYFIRRLPQPQRRRLRPPDRAYARNARRRLSTIGWTRPVRCSRSTTRSACKTASAQPFPGNIIPKDRFDPQSVKAIAAYASGPGGQVKPNVTAAPGTVAYVLNNFITTSGSRIQPADKFSVETRPIPRGEGPHFLLLRLQPEPRDSRA